MILILIFRKNALTELAVKWNPASEEFVQIGLRMESCTDIIQPCEEYNDYTKKLVPNCIINIDMKFILLYFIHLRLAKYLSTLIQYQHFNRLQRITNNNTNNSMIMLFSIDILNK